MPIDFLPLPIVSVFILWSILIQLVKPFYPISVLKLKLKYSAIFFRAGLFFGYLFSALAKGFGWGLQKLCCGLFKGFGGSSIYTTNSRHIKFAVDLFQSARPEF